MVRGDLEVQEQTNDAADPIPDEARALLGEVETEDETTASENNEPSAPEVPTRELIAPLVALVCVVVVPAWEISKAEQDALTDAYAAVVDKYFPGGVSMGPELGALLVTGAIIAPRLGKPARPEPEPEPEPPKPSVMPERGQDGA